MTCAPSIQRRPCPDESWLEDDLVGDRVEVEVDGAVRFGRLGIGCTGVHSARESVANFGSGAAEVVAAMRVELPDGRRGDAGEPSGRSRYRVAFTAFGR